MFDNLDIDTYHELAEKILGRRPRTAGLRAPWIDWQNGEIREAKSNPGDLTDEEEERLAIEVCRLVPGIVRADFHKMDRTQRIPWMEKAIDPKSDIPLLEKAQSKLTSQEQKIMTHLWDKETASFDVLRSVPGAFTKDNVSDEAVEKKIKRIREKLEKHDIWDVELSISGTRVNLSKG